MYPAPYTGTELPSVGFNSFGAYEINVGLVTYNYVCLIQCLNQNKQYTYATYLNTTVNTYSGNKRCVCSQDVSLGNPTVCTQNSFYVYTRNAVADDPNMSESVMRRRRLLQEMKAAEAAANPYCPRGFEACRTTAGGYECIDTSEELGECYVGVLTDWSESCGGCVHGSFDDDKASGVEYVSNNLAPLTPAAHFSPVSKSLPSRATRVAVSPPAARMAISSPTARVCPSKPVFVLVACRF